MQNKGRLPGTLPAELAQFFKRESFSLLVKGTSGTGKTTLVLTALRNLGLLRDCLYISTRLSPAQLLQNHPWLRQQLGDAKEPQPKAGEIENQNIGPFIDGRLDEPASLFERVTSELMDVRGPVVVIDSWDPIGSLMDNEALQSNTRVLQTWRERAGAKLFLVTENPENLTFDPLVDGILVLEQKNAGGRLEREILVKKLQGVDISRSSYPFSLQGGIFTVLTSADRSVGSQR